MTPARAPAGAGLSVALAPVRSAVVAAAEQYAERVRAQADAAAEAQVAAARARAADLVAQADAEGAAEAGLLLAADRGRARRAARGVLLAAQRSAYDQLRRATRDEARRLAAEVGLAGVQHRLAALARDRLGADARVAADAAGVVAETPGRRVEWSFDALADQAVDDLGPEVATLWTP